MGTAETKLLSDSAAFEANLQEVLHIRRQLPVGHPHRAAFDEMLLRMEEDPVTTMRTFTTFKTLGA